MPQDYQHQGRRQPQRPQSPRNGGQQPYPTHGRHGTAPNQPVMNGGGMQPATGRSREDEIRSVNEALANGSDGGYTRAFAPITDEQSTQYRQSKKHHVANLAGGAPAGQQTPEAAEGAGVVPVVEFEHVTKIYPSQPDRPALDDISMKIYPGEFVFIIGASGSGKSTTLNMIIAQKDARPTSGTVRIAGQNLAEISNKRLPYLRRQIGAVFQDFKLLDDKTVYENVAFVLECLGRPEAMIRQQVPEVLKLVGLADQMNSYPNQLSGGEQQRVSIARAMVNRPPLLICDEPTGNLDPAISEGIMQLLERINKTGTTVICSTHDRDTVEKRRRRVIAFTEGHLIYDEQNSGYVQPAVITEVQQ